MGNHFIFFIWVVEIYEIIIIILYKEVHKIVIYMIIIKIVCIRWKGIVLSNSVIPQNNLKLSIVINSVYVEFRSRLKGIEEKIAVESRYECTGLQIHINHGIKVNYCNSFWIFWISYISIYVVKGNHKFRKISFFFCKIKTFCAVRINSFLSIYSKNMN